MVGDYSGNINSFNTVNIDNHYWSDEEDDGAGNGIERIIAYSAHYKSDF